MTRHTYDLYGSRVLSVEAMRMAVEPALEIDFSWHESDYMGGDYLLFLGSFGEKFRIQRNELVDEDGPFLFEPEFGEYVTLLSVDKVSDGDFYRLRLESVNGLEFLRREVI